MGGDGRGLSRGTGNDAFAVDECPAAEMRGAEPSGQAIVDPARSRHPAIGARDDNAERWLAACEVACAVDRIDDPAGLVETVEDRRVRMRSFLAHEGKTVIKFGKAFAQQLLAVLVGHRDGIVAALVLDLARSEIAVARHDRLRGHAFEQCAHGGVEMGVGSTGHER